MQDGFVSGWNEAAVTTMGLFWMALWAFALGYLASSLIQVLVTRTRMQRAMGESGPKAMALGSFFGFIASSCSFAALSTTRALFQKGAGLAPAMAFMLASTNLVIELGIVIALFLGWQFVVGEYVGGLLLILFAWLFIGLTRPVELVERVRRRLRERHGDGGDDGEPGDWRRKLGSLEGWERIGRTYVGEWGMVWKDVLIGFTVAGVISAFVPAAFFETLFIGAGSDADPGFLAVLQHTLVGPAAAFMSFIGSMGNIPLAALLYENGVSFAGIMAFIFSDLVVLPVLRINAQYYGWKLALYILLMLLCGLVVVSLLMHYGFAVLGMLPQGAGKGPSLGERDFFTFDYGFALNLVFLAASAILGWLAWRARDGEGGHRHGGAALATRLLRAGAVASALWLLGGLLVAPLLR